MDIRLYKSEDYNTIWHWWREHKSFAPEEDILPENGFMAFNDKYDIAAGFLYKMDCQLCAFEFVVTNPITTTGERDIALDLLIKSAIKLSKNEGYKLIYISTGIQRYINRLKDNNFIEADKNQTHMFRSL